MNVSLSLKNWSGIGDWHLSVRSLFGDWEKISLGCHLLGIGDWGIGKFRLKFLFNFGCMVIGDSTNKKSGNTIGQAKTSSFTLALQYFYHRYSCFNEFLISKFLHLYTAIFVYQYFYIFEKILIFHTEKFQYWQ